nr:unnamed protein product [Digitaria exilis]
MRRAVAESFESSWCERGAGKGEEAAVQHGGFISVVGTWEKTTWGTVGPEEEPGPGPRLRQR